MAFLLSLVLVVAGLTNPPPAQAAVPACSVATDPATAFVKGIGDDPVSIRIGCAGDAGSLRTLAESSNDLIVAYDFNGADERPASPNWPPRSTTHRN